MSHTPQHPEGVLGLHVALYRLVRRSMADGGLSPTEVTLAAEDQHGPMVRELIERATGDKLLNARFATDSQLTRACGLLIRELRTKKNRPHAWWPDGWRQSARWVMPRVRNEQEKNHG